MLNLGRASLRVYLAVGATDLRKAFDGLQGVVREKMESDPLRTSLCMNFPRIDGEQWAV